MAASADERERRRMRRAGDDASTFMRPRTEAARERDAFRFLHPWVEANQPAFVNRGAFPHNDDLMPEPEGCPDTALTALTQLAALRLDARRAFVTLVSTDVEYVLAEATKSMSLQYDVFDDPKDFPWLGTCSFLRSEGVNDLAIHSWRKARRLREVPEDEGFWYTDGISPHAFIVSDVRKDARCSQRSFVQRAPWLRFYCSVPLRDHHGSVLGSLAITSDKPRYGISINEMAFLEDMSDTITEHLEATIVRSQRQRSERLIQGLSLFNRGKDSLSHWWLAQDDARRRRAGRYQQNNIDLEGQNERLAKEFGTQELSNTSPASTRTGRRSNVELKETLSVSARCNSAAANDRRVEHVAFHDFGASLNSAAKPSQPEFVGESLSGDEHDRASQPPRSETSSPSISRGTSRSSAKRRPLVGPFNLTTASKHAYSRASNLIREAVSAEGVAFVDASSASTIAKQLRRRGSPSSNHSGATASQHATTSTSASTSTSDAPNSSMSDEDTSDAAKPDDSICKLNGFSTRNKSTLKGSPSSDHRFKLPDASLASLIRRYPHGKIFNFEDSGDLYSSSGDDQTPAGSGGDSTGVEGKSPRKPHRRQSSDAKQLGNVMVGARSIVFFPIWDDSTERWRTCLFAWSTTPLRFFDPTEDITYLSAFSHSLIAELGRLETLASDTAKGTFISSISHELRSPLHGVLAGAEFLQESELSAFQSQMVSTISMAGRTLLETVNHLLDWSKISNFSHEDRKERAAADKSRHQSAIAGDGRELGVTACVDLARLTEEVVETVVSARRFERRAQNPANRNITKAMTGSDRDLSEPKTAQSVSVTVDIDWRESWMVDISPGSWTRILTNLIGNALKYTHTGTVAVKLSAEDAPSDGGPHRGSVVLTVEDTGIGMSAQFLANGLYTPFKQADSHSTGTGLGLSIVKQIAKDLHADIDVNSQLGKGTRVAVSFRAKFAARDRVEDATPSEDANLLHTVRDLDVKRFHVYEFDDRQRDDGPNGWSKAVSTSASNMAAQWLRCETSSGPHMDATSGASVCVIAESDLLWLADQHPDQLSTMLRDLAARHALPLIIADSMGSVSSDFSFNDFPIEPVFIPQAVGPRKLLRSVAKARESLKPFDAIDAAAHDTDQDVITPRDLSSNAQGGEAEGHQFPWHGRNANTTSRDGAFAEEQHNVPVGGTSLRPQKRPRVSRMPTSTFSSFLSPTSAGDPPSPEATTPAGDAGKGYIDGSTILLVEDNEINMNLLKALMKKLKLQYACAGDGQQALDVYSATPSKFNLILMDMSMPVMDGFTSTARIREEERKRRLPRCMIVALTGVTSSESRESALRSGVDKYFTKPIRMKDLSALVAETTH